MHEAHTADGTSANILTNGVKILEALHLVRLASVKGEERLAAATLVNDRSGLWIRIGALGVRKGRNNVGDWRKGTATLDRFLKGTPD